jgi:hypothetical protein
MPFRGIVGGIRPLQNFDTPKTLFAWICPRLALAAQLLKEKTYPPMFLAVTPVHPVQPLPHKAFRVPVALFATGYTGYTTRRETVWDNVPARGCPGDAPCRAESPR